MRTVWFLAAVAVLATLPAAAAGPARTDPGVLAIDWRTPGRERLVLADPITLRPRGATSLGLAGHAWPYAFNADRSRLVLGRWQPPSLRLVDGRRLRAIRDVPLGGLRRLEIKAVAWLGRRIVVLVEKRSSGLALLRVDPAEGRVVASTRIGRSAHNVAVTQTRFVVLLSPLGNVGHAMLLVVTNDRVRMLRLTGIEAGSVPARRGRPHTVIQPGLAVSPRTPKAWVIGTERSAVVHLETLRVRYRPEPREPSSRQKEPVVGGARHAHWLSAGRLVVAGWDARVDEGSVVFESRGLRLLETTRWTERTIHPRALLFYVEGRRLLTVAPEQPACAAPALTAYTLSGVESYRVCEQRATGELQLAGRYGRLGRVDGRVAVVELDTGTIVARLPDVRVSPIGTALVQEP